MRVAFSGTREGMTPNQFIQLNRWILDNLDHIEELHHGACVGADVEFHEIAVRRGLLKKIHIHPSNNGYTNFLVECESWREAAKIYPELHPLDRDMIMVQSADVLLITPKSDDEVRRSGTWTTKRMAKRLRLPVIHFRLFTDPEAL